jgi:hypothetical protein
MPALAGPMRIERVGGGQSNPAAGSAAAANAAEQAHTGSTYLDRAVCLAPER